MRQLNVGCGPSPTPGWKNYDNSWSVRLARRPKLALLLEKAGILGRQQIEFIRSARQGGIGWADVAKRIPEPDASAEAIYSSHMLEHLDRDQAMRFLKEARRVLVSGGILRLAVPNVGYHINNYLEDRDADRFVAATRLTRPRPRSFPARLKYLFIGDRHHQWMYDGDSLCRLLSAAGFANARVMQGGTTTIPEPGQLNLREREPESVFVEAINP